MFTAIWSVARDACLDCRQHPNQYRPEFACGGGFLVPSRGPIGRIFVVLLSRLGTALGSLRSVEPHGRPGARSFRCQVGARSASVDCHPWIGGRDSDPGPARQELARHIRIRACGARRLDHSNRWRHAARPIPFGFGEFVADVRPFRNRYEFDRICIGHDRARRIVRTKPYRLLHPRARILIHPPKFAGSGICRSPLG